MPGTSDATYAKCHACGQAYCKNRADGSYIIRDMVRRRWVHLTCMAMVDEDHLKRLIEQMPRQRKGDLPSKELRELGLLEFTLDLYAGTGKGADTSEEAMQC